MIGVPLQYSHDIDIGPVRNGSKDHLNVQPVMPPTISEDWNLIARAIAPLVALHDVPTHGHSESILAALGTVVNAPF